MIISFGHDLAEHVFLEKQSKVSRKLSANLRMVALRKLQYLNSASNLQDLRSPPGNRLEILKGNLKGYHSIRINDQWRIVFIWRDGAQDVKILDYH